MIEFLTVFGIFLVLGAVFSIGFGVGYIVSEIRSDRPRI